MYTLKILDKAKKFRRKYQKNRILMNRLDKKFRDILNNPFRPEFIYLKSNKCPRCQRAKMGDYRIIFYVNTDINRVDIIDIIHRSNDYRLY